MESTRQSEIPLRSPQYVMRLERMGSFHQTRLSFMRALLRHLNATDWKFERKVWRINDKGVGVAVYRATGQKHTYSLICYAHDLPDDKRSDRVIAEQWDATFTLFDGVPTEADISRLAQNVPKQEAGHCSDSELVLSRANRSVRLFEHVVDCLSQGQQPDTKMIDSIGYLMRTTAVYGNGKFGISDLERISDRTEFFGAFRAELLTVWLIRWFTLDITEYMAKCYGGEKAVKLDRKIRRRLGVGNSTGLGMAPFLILHPALIHSWMQARETALARVRGIAESNANSKAQFSKLISRMMLGVESWNTSHELQQSRIDELRQDLLKLTAYVKTSKLAGNLPWDGLIKWSEEKLSIEGQELVVSLVIEPHGDLVDDLADDMAVDEAQYFPIDGSRNVRSLSKILNEQCQWALDVDYSDQSQCARFWYYSEEKLEPRVGDRFNEPGADKEHPLSYGRDISLLSVDLKSFIARQHEDSSVAAFLLHHPQHRHAVRRVQMTEQLPYAEIQDNLISDSMMPIDLLRCKLSFFGACKFDPRSDRWVRINMYQHAPFPDELNSSNVDDWVYPPLT